MFKASDVTVYIPFYNAWGSIEKCLQNLLSQTFLPARIIVIDDGSAEPFHTTRSRVEVIRIPENRGLAAARNMALGACDTPLIASLDSDVMPAKDWLERLLAVMNVNDKTAGCGGRLNEYYSSTLGDRWRAVHMAQHWGDKTIVNPRFLYGANNLFRTDVLKGAGGYMTELRSNYEDMSMSEKLYAKGERLVYEPYALCYHLRRDDEKSILPGFWKWFYSKGMLNGEFKNKTGLISRIDSVAFGIYRYRFDMDKTAGRKEFLMLDALIPWVFAALDLRFAANTFKLNVPQFPDDKIMALLPRSLRSLFTGIIKPSSAELRYDKWHAKYNEKFIKLLETSKWLEDMKALSIF